MSVTIITGGQLGVDLGAWKAAWAADLPRGGWMPAGFATEGGPRPNFAAHYGARALPEEWTHRPMAAQYRERTRRNVESATHVLLLTADPESPGSRLTWRLATEMERERFVVMVHGHADLDPDEFRSRGYYGPIARELVKDCTEKGGVLMVAGTRESRAPGIGAWAESFLAPIFREFAASAITTEDA